MGAKWCEGEKEKWVESVSEMCEAKCAGVKLAFVYKTHRRKHFLTCNVTRMPKRTVSKN